MKINSLDFHYNGQVGKCSNDDKKRIKGEPYTERVDIKQ